MKLIPEIIVRTSRLELVSSPSKSDNNVVTTLRLCLNVLNNQAERHQLQNLTLHDLDELGKQWRTIENLRGAQQI